MHMPPKPTRISLPYSRWLNVALRTLHLLAVVALAVEVLGNEPQAEVSRLIALLVVLSGLAMFVLDFLRNSGHLREVAGVAVLFKLALCGWMVLQPSLVVPIFWALVFVSSLISHAPKNFRHHIWWPEKSA